MYVNKIFVFEDHEGHLTSSFKSYFEEIGRKAVRIAPEELASAIRAGEAQKEGSLGCGAE